MNPEFSTEFRKTLSYKISWKSTQRCSIRTDRQTRMDRYNGANSRFSESAKAPKKTTVRCHLCDNLTSNKKMSFRNCGLSRAFSSVFHIAQRHISSEEIWPYSTEWAGLTIHAAVDRTQRKTDTTNIISINVDYTSPRKEHFDQTPWVFGKRQIIYVLFCKHGKIKNSSA